MNRTAAQVGTAVFDLKVVQTSRQRDVGNLNIVQCTEGQYSTTKEIQSEDDRKKYIALCNKSIKYILLHVLKRDKKTTKEQVAATQALTRHCSTLRDAKCNVSRLSK